MLSSTFSASLHEFYLIISIYSSIHPSIHLTYLFKYLQVEIKASVLHRYPSYSIIWNTVINIELFTSLVGLPETLCGPYTLCRSCDEYSYMTYTFVISSSMFFSYFLMTCLFCLLSLICEQFCQRFV